MAGEAQGLDWWGAWLHTAALPTPSDFFCRECTEKNTPDAWDDQVKDPTAIRWGKVEDRIGTV